MYAVQLEIMIWGQNSNVGEIGPTKEFFTPLEVVLSLILLLLNLILKCKSKVRKKN